MFKIIWSMLSCKHRWKFERKIHGDEINYRGGNRSEYWCEKCGLYEYRPELHSVEKQKE